MQPGVVFTSVVLRKEHQEHKTFTWKGRNNWLVIDKGVIIFFFKCLKEKFLNLVFKRVGIYWRFRIQGEIVPELRSKIGDGRTTTFSVTVGLNKCIRWWSSFILSLVSRGIHFIHVLWGQFILLFEDMSIYSPTPRPSLYW